MALLRGLLTACCVHILCALGIVIYEMWNISKSSLKYSPAEADATKTMLAAQFAEFGNASVVQLHTIQQPKCCNPGQVRVKVAAGALNPVDFKQRRMEAPAMMRPLPSVSGFDFSGVITQVGEGVLDFQAGDRVYGMLPLLGQRWGAFQEFAVVDTTVIAHAPKSIPLREAAALPLVGLTVLHAMEPVLKEWKAKGEKTDGKQILIHAGAGGV